MHAVGRRTERTVPVAPGTVEATAASAHEEADHMPSAPAAAHDELDYNVMRFNTLRDSRAERLRIGPSAKRPPATGLLHVCRRRARFRFVEVPAQKHLPPTDAMAARCSYAVREGSAGRERVGDDLPRLV